MKIRVLPGRTLVHNIKHGERKIGGIIIVDDDGKDSGIRPRWAQVYTVGPDITDYKKGDWLYIDHGRWSRPITITVDDEKIKLYQVDPDAILAVSTSEPTDDGFNTNL